MPLADAYPLVKTTHVGLAIASGTLFALRGVAMLLGSTRANHVRVRYLSYTIDTALLATALLLLVVLSLNPFAVAWLTVKLALLVAYIVLGSLALKRAPTRSARALAFVAALLCFAAIYRIARTHDPLGFLIG